ncbi:Putative uncharacterized protein [Taphrina deformans PYCC 5710]|uniref:NADP-dependent oxidoreductase domain-containing protein n=1 Tax=Taphrina deformans (strain PYCC 5710 / ATCC 11124 / CBS 356.35 / IMI 108563 / JCM 9778 / NBRC 8474) TaxID=1097556 RepID=R4XBE4_TAPDE|nr:Putative uncharacterized protein [Taphrina deformans PYCC 5710]|eukprot:CCG81686.1 Putative uncharacterized protein [Taphrina deformans PYCC 5710]
MSSAASLPFGKRISLSDGKSIPQLGFGVYEMSGREARRAVREALDHGYRHIDSAAWYMNEKECGEAINDFIAASDGLVKRADIYYTSKLRSNSTYEQAVKAIKKSVSECGLGYLDLYLIHSPYPNRAARLASWKAMEEAVEQGLVKSIGVSNYGTRHIDELLASRPAIRPVINQIDVHPFMARAEDVKYNQDRQIVVEAWGPLARGMRMNDETMVRIAEGHGKSVAQVLIRYSLQRGCVCIPKSVTTSRIMENKEVFDFTLSDQEMDTLNALDEGLVTDWDPIGDSSV